MKTIPLKQLFSLTNYDYNLTKNPLFTINAITKTRVDPSKSLVTQHFGIEQSFFLQYMCNRMNTTNYIEIGTGRGTSAYSVAMLESVKRVDSFDIIPFNYKFNAAVNFKPFYGSNKDLFDMIPYDEKNKIHFLHPNSLNTEYLSKNRNLFDVAFIDGNHTEFEVIYGDFLNSMALTKDDGIIVFDDYGNFPVVTSVIDKVISEHPEFTYIFVPFRGHLFQTDKACNVSGEVVLFKNRGTLSKFGL